MLPGDFVVAEGDPLEVIVFLSTFVFAVVHQRAYRNDFDAFKQHIKVFHLLACIVNFVPLKFGAFERLAGGNGVAGVAAASTAGNAATVPVIIAASNPVYAEAAKSATIIVAACVVVTAILVPLVTAWVAKRVNTPPTAGEA